MEKGPQGRDVKDWYQKKRKGTTATDPEGTTIVLPGMKRKKQTLSQKKKNIGNEGEGGSGDELAVETEKKQLR